MSKYCQKCKKDTVRHKDGRCAPSRTSYNRRLYAERGDVREKTAARNKAYARDNREKFREYSKRSAMNNKDAQILRNWRRNLKKYGLTLEQYVEMYVAQRGACRLCKKLIPLRGRDTHVDHCHEMNKVRGNLCGTCNPGIGMLKNEANAYRALHYLMTNGDSVPSDWQVRRIVAGLKSLQPKNRFPDKNCP